MFLCRLQFLSILAIISTESLQISIAGFLLKIKDKIPWLFKDLFQDFHKLFTRKKMKRSESFQMSLYFSIL